MGGFLDTVPLKDYAHDTLCIEVKFILRRCGSSLVALQTKETVVPGSNSEDRQSTVYFKISGQRGRPSPGTKKIFYLIACMCNTEHVTCIKNNVTTTCVKQCKKS